MWLCLLGVGWYKYSVWANEQHLKRVRVGMSTAQALAIMGTPRSINTQRNPTGYSYEYEAGLLADDFHKVYIRVDRPVVVGILDQRPMAPYLGVKREMLRWLLY